MVSLANHIKEQREKQGCKPGQEKDDCTLATSTSTFLAMSHSEDDQSFICDNRQNHRWNEEEEEDDDECSVFSSLALSSHCSFRPENSVCLRDFVDGGEELEALDLSSENDDVYDVIRRSRRGEEEADLEIATQAAMLAREMLSRPSLGRIRRPTLRKPGLGLTLPKQQAASRKVDAASPSTPTVPLEPEAVQTNPFFRFIQQRVETFSRNMETLTMVATGECGAPRMETFTRNMETLTMMATGECEAPWEQDNASGEEDNERAHRAHRAKIASV